MELRNNLNVLSNGFRNKSSFETIMTLLSNEAIQAAIQEGFAFKKLRAGTIEPYHVFEDRNRKYIGWTAEKLVDKIDEKMVELKNIQKLNNGSFTQAKNNIPMMMSNLYFRMKLLADFIKGEK